MAKKFLGLSLFYWGLILLVVLFLFFGMGKVTEGFLTCEGGEKLRTVNRNMDECKNDPKCSWNKLSGNSRICKCCKK